ncbi:acetyl-CoA synthetase-like protein [Aspergillus heteromorphus CBS 117.55]|uniref:Acetyl-CoA synthetase-like protein n=1 Tax=Aspergillus heteromorphus CBS 117.55 TaxID=1448321 RepID=A0A317V4B5_9EURO|nr:acetyl-CoA synthetase-like protein [Aspergillus heteromorphus CBS 117.55]PWY69123.1 acetyl-CoA synthetase-like protein [Aspergillus heteromorphus CBS 117.55]
MNVFGTTVDPATTLHGGECGKRLIPHIIDATARVTPDVECLSIPRTNGNPRDGWKPVSWAQVANAVNYVAHLLVKQAGHPELGTFLTVAYIGLEDPRYPIFVVGAIKAGYQALLISSRNSVEAQLNLFDKTDCNLLYHDVQYASTVQPWVDGRSGMEGVTAAPWEEWVANVAPFSYTKTFAEAEWDPYVVLHTTGSTGLPKPVVIPQGMLALNDLHRTIPPRDGNRTWFPTWTSFPNPRYLLIFPLFHTAGIMTSKLCGFYYNAPIAFRDPSVPITGDNVVDWLQNSNPGWTLMPPTILEQMWRSQQAVDELKKLHAVGFGGGAIAPTPANDLLSQGIQRVNAIATTEYIYFPYYAQPDASLWPWFIVPTEMMGIEWRPFGENTYEQVFIRQNKDHPGLQGCFYAFPELAEFSTKDLYRPHPTLANHWTYVGRADDIIVFSTGEKLNPTTIEGAVMGHPGVLGAQVVGSGHFHAALLIEPAQQPQNEPDKQRFLDEIWPIIEKVNVETVAHSRILREYVFLSDPTRPFPRAGKGTIQRCHDGSATAVDLDLTSKPAFTDSIRSLTQGILQLPTLNIDEDLFAAGVDSLQVIQLARVLRVSLEKAGHETAIEPRVIYTHPTITQLAGFVYNLTSSKPKPNTPSSTPSTLTISRSLIAKYTTNLPPPSPTKPSPRTTNQTILITGTTGDIGSYLLDLALSSPSIHHIICLNRSSDAQARQTAANASRGLSTDFSRTTFLTANLSAPLLGLSPSTHHILTHSVDRIIHNAWPVNFNLSLPSFEPHLLGIRHLIDFSAAAVRTVSIAFVSSVSTVDSHAWPTPSVPVPEKPLPDDSLSERAIGYAHSKLTASLILDAAAEVSGIPRQIIRVGQEWLPSLIRSSLFLGLLPDGLGRLGALGWAPIEDVARVVLEVSGVSLADQDAAPDADADTDANANGHVHKHENGRVNEEEITIAGYFHALNPHPTHWPSLIPAIREFYGQRIKRVVSLGEWVSALKESRNGDGDGDGEGDLLEENPAVKLVDTYRWAVAGGEEGLTFATNRTRVVSPKLRDMAGC